MTTKPTWRALIDAKIIKRTDNGMEIIPSAIRIVPGFNLRDVTAPDYREDIDALKLHIRNGGKVPSLEVTLSADGCGVDVVDGHRRTTAILELIAEGTPISYVRIDPFGGKDGADEIQRTARIMSSQEGRKLRPLEIAEGIRRFSAWGLSPEQIAATVGKTRQHIDQMLILASAPIAVKQMVKAGNIAYGLAVETIRQMGPDAAVQKLGAAQVDAAASGKTKVTKQALKPWTPPAKVVTPILESAQQLAKGLPKDMRAWLTADTAPPEGETVEVDAGWMRQLLVDIAGMSQAEKDAKAKAKAKAEKASQLAIPGTDGA